MDGKINIYLSDVYRDIGFEAIIREN